MIRKEAVKLIAQEIGNQPIISANGFMSRDLYETNEKSLVFMQNAGFANSLSTITSLIKLYEIPMILLIGWRGFLKDDAPEHEKIGEIQPELIKIIGLESKIINDKNFKNVCDWAIMKLKKGKIIALIIKRDFLD